MSKKSLLIVLALLLLSGVRTLAADSAPAWLQAASQQTLPHVDKDIPAIVLLDEGSVTFNDKGQLVKRQRFAIKILTKEGKSYTGQSVHYNNDSKVNDFVGWHI